MHVLQIENVILLHFILSRSIFSDFVSFISSGCFISKSILTKDASELVFEIVSEDIILYQTNIKLNFLENI
jgi:hypothetical protein